MPRSIVQDTDDGAVLTVHAQPKAARTEFVGVHGDALKFRVAAPPVEGAANEELCGYLAAQFGLSKRDVVIRAGQGARHKHVLLRNVAAGRVREVLKITS